jgi:hypothetical protein
LSDSRLSRWALHAFTLEGGLIVGLVMLLAGIGIDVSILWRWLEQRGSAQDDTIHVAFAATLLIVLGINIVFSSFLLSMFAAHQRDQLTEPPRDPQGEPSTRVGPNVRMEAAGPKSP